MAFSSQNQQKHTQLGRRGARQQNARVGAPAGTRLFRGPWVHAGGRPTRAEKLAAPSQRTCRVGARSEPRESTGSRSASQPRPSARLRGPPFRTRKSGSQAAPREDPRPRSPAPAVSLAQISSRSFKKKSAGAGRKVKRSGNAVTGYRSLRSGGTRECGGGP